MRCRRKLEMGRRGKRTGCDEPDDADDALKACRIGRSPCRSRIVQAWKQELGRVGKHQRSSKGQDTWEAHDSGSQIWVRQHP